MPARNKYQDLRNEFEQLKAKAKSSTGERVVKEVLSFREFATRYVAPLTLGFENAQGNTIRRLDYPHLDVSYDLLPKAHKFLRLDPRGHLKSTVDALAYPVWKLYYNPQKRVILASSTRTHAIEGLYAIAQVLMKLGAKPYRPDKWRQDRIMLDREYASKDPSVGAISVESSEVGFHGDIFIGDDLHDDKNSPTPAGRRQVSRFMESVITGVMEPNSQWLLDGTRWHYDDHYSQIIKKGKPWVPGMDLSKEYGWVYMIRSVWVNEAERMTLFPDKFTPEYVEGLKKDMPPHWFAMQYLNDPMQAEDKPLQDKWLTHYNPETVPWGFSDMNWYTIQAVDLISSERERRDWFISLILSRNRDGQFYLRDMIRKQCSISDEIKDIEFHYNTFHPNKVVIDATGFQIIITKFLQASTNWPVVGINQREHKKERILALAPFFQSQRILTDFKAPWFHDFQLEYLEYPDSKWDDQLDTLSMAISGFDTNPGPPAFLLPPLERTAGGRRIYFTNP